MAKTTIGLFAGIFIGVIAVLCFQMVTEDSGAVTEKGLSENGDIHRVLGELRFEIAESQKTIARNRDVLDSIRNENEYRSDDLEAMMDKMELLTDAIQNQRIDGQVIAEGIHDEKRESIDPSPKLDEILNSNEDSSGWVSVLDKSVARALVEKGMTPFEDGVSPILEKAGIKIRAAGAELASKQKDWRARHPSVHRSDPLYETYISEKDAIWNEYKFKRDEALELFKKELQELKQGN